MTESNETVVTETTETRSRFNLRKALKVAVLTITGLAVAIWLKRKLTGDVSGEVTATVGTNDQA